jgi:hypothetical protein
MDFREVSTIGTGGEDPAQPRAACCSGGPIVALYTLILGRAEIRQTSRQDVIADHCS